MTDFFDEKPQEAIRQKERAIADLVYGKSGSFLRGNGRGARAGAIKLPTTGEDR